MDKRRKYGYGTNTNSERYEKASGSIRKGTLYRQGGIKNDRERN